MSGRITYLLTDLAGNRIEELPLTNTSFSLTLNAAGQFSGDLQVDDPRVQALAWLSATAPNLTQIWVDIDGALVYGGRVTKRTYTRNKGAITVKGLDHWSYCAQRLQAVDYSSTWATTPAGAAQISRQVMVDALAVANSMPLAVSTPGATPTTYGITLAAPISQRMTVDAIANQLSGLGWLVGFDFATDVAYVSGVPTATLTLSYPRRGRIAGTTGLMIDVASATDFSYDEDGTGQAMSIVETATGNGGLASSGVWDAAMSVDKYPLLERVGIHSSFSSAATSTAVLEAYVANDLALYAYPITTPVVTKPLFAEPGIGEYIVGDDVRLVVPVTSVQGVPADPRFPAGMDFYWRLVRADVTVPAAGVPMVAMTFNIPPSSTPQRPPR